ncbi:MAG: hypothetical protein M0R37_10540 [Bacteroidales bacterium]|jgi:hypothetical protein|nr:hypothetical protein [Bacteroidales bacterium]
MPEMPELTPWAPVVPTFPDLPAEIPWPPDFDFEYDVSPWYVDPTRPPCYDAFAARVMALLNATALHRAALGLRPMYPPFDLRYMMATPTLVNLATLWLATAWNLHMHAPHPAPDWTTLWDYTVSQSGYVKATRSAINSQCQISPTLNAYSTSIYSGESGSLHLAQTSNVSAANVMSLATFRRYAPYGGSYVYAQVGVSKKTNGDWELTFIRAGGVSTDRSYTGASIDIDIELSGGDVIYRVNGAVIFNEAACTSATAGLGMVTVDTYVPYSQPAGTYVRLDFTVSSTHTDCTSDPRSDEHWDAWEEGPSTSGNHEWGIGAAGYTESIHYVDGGGGTPTVSITAITPLTIAALDCGLMMSWLSAVENVMWPHLRS